MSGHSQPLSTALHCPQCSHDLIQYLGVWGVCENCSNTAFHLGSPLNPGQHPVDPTRTARAVRAQPGDSRQDEQLRDGGKNRDTQLRSMPYHRPVTSVPTAREDMERSESPDYAPFDALMGDDVLDMPFGFSLPSLDTNPPRETPIDSGAPSPDRSLSPRPASPAAVPTTCNRLHPRPPHPPRFHVGQRVRIREDALLLPNAVETELLARAENIVRVLERQTSRLQHAISLLRSPLRDKANFSQLHDRKAALDRQLLDTMLEIWHATACESERLKRS